MKNNKILLTISLSILSLSLISCGQDSLSSNQDYSSNLSTSLNTTSESSSSHGGPGNSSQGGGPDGGGGNSITYSGSKEFTSTSTEENQTYASATNDQSSVLCTTSNVVGTIKSPTITKSGDTSSADNSSFYGLNSSVLATSGTINVKDGTIVSTGEGAAGLCAYSAGIIYADGTSITTSKNAAGGVHVCGGGSLYGWDLSAVTQGEHSAAVRSDRGGGTISLQRGTFVSNGSGSPAVYSTADIQIKDATLIANDSEAASIEGKNNIELFNCDLTGNMSDSAQNQYTWGVILYQSSSGDSEEGTSIFSMENGSLDIKNGGFFHTNSTSSEFILKNVELKYTGNDNYEFLINCCGNSRWNSGAGATCNFTCINQNMSGLVEYDSASSLDLYLSNNSVWNGQSRLSTVYTGSNTSSIHIDSGSSWNVTGDSTIDYLYNEGSIKDSSNNLVTIISNGETMINGTSPYKITVSKKYVANANLDNILKSPTFNDVEEPSIIS